MLDRARITAQVRGDHNKLGQKSVLVLIPPVLSSNDHQELRISLYLRPGRQRVDRQLRVLSRAKDNLEIERTISPSPNSCDMGASLGSSNRALKGTCCALISRYSVPRRVGTRRSAGAEQGRSRCPEELHQDGPYRQHSAPPRPPVRPCRSIFDRAHRP